MPVTSAGRLQQNAAWQSFRRVLISAVFVLIMFVVAGYARQSFETRDSLEAFTGYLDGRIISLMDQYGVPGVSIALVRKGKPVWSGAYGYADLEHGRKMTVNAVFRVESISKSVTAWGVMRLVEQGLVRLDDPVQQYLGDWKLPESGYTERKVTVRRLLSNSAGMPLGTIGEEFSPQSNMPSLRETLALEARLIREPGSGFSYSNAGFHVLELLVEEVTGRDFAEYMKEEILIPLDMHNSGFAWNETLNTAIPTGYDLQGTPVPIYVYPAKASGGLFASVEDIARFVSAGMTGPYYTDHAVLGQESIRKLYTPEADISGLFGVVADSYGLGYFLENLSDGRQAVWHGGQGHGWMTHFHAVPETGNGIIILTNSQRSWPLIAQVLNDWARWSGFNSVKMGRITYAITALRALIGMVVLVSLLQMYQLVRGLLGGTRRLAPLSRVSRKVRLLQAVLGIGVIAALTWSVAQPYLMVSSIFPGTAGWAGVSFFVLAVIMLLSALIPRVEDRIEQGR
ncbi:MAG: serine hydrolase domain-containing protein [Nitrospirota bacterium]|nr:serine hydrolase domain-containing protein [Nitrospirota bacterium]